MAIILVLVAVITAGGMRMGQSLVFNARIRAQISQIDQINTAVNTFQAKYNGLPGDLTPAEASQFNLYAGMTNGGQRGYGDDNGELDGGGAGYPVYTDCGSADGELAIFWRHLSEAGLIPGTLTGSSGNDYASYTQAQIPTLFPQGKLSVPASIVLMRIRGYGPDYGYWYVLDQITSIPNSSGGLWGPKGASTTPVEAFAIDCKIDDGSPWTGKVWNVGGWNWGTPESDPCAVFTPPGTDANGADICYKVDWVTNPYYIDGPLANSPECALAFQVGW